MLYSISEIDQAGSSSYHPSGNDLIGWFHRCMGIFQAPTSEIRRNLLLPNVGAYRTSVHDSIDSSPNLLTSRNENMTPLDFIYGRSQRRKKCSYSKSLTERTEIAYRLWYENERPKHAVDVRLHLVKFADGDCVLYIAPVMQSMKAVVRNESKCTLDFRDHA